MKPFASEADVRKWVKAWATAPQWIEPTRGSTVGTPDVWVADMGGAWLELKNGDFDPGTGRLTWKMRPGQNREIRNLRGAWARVGLLVGYGTRLFVTSDPLLIKRETALAFQAETWDAEDPETWGKIMGKIVSDCSAAIK